MNPLIYRLMYLLTRPGWDTGTTPPQLAEAFAQDSILPGAALDLGCGTGTHTIFMAQQGRMAIGIDYVPEAIARARKKARQNGIADKAQFLVGDATRLDKLSLPPCSFALDVGCFHGLDRQEQQRYVEGLSAVLRPGGQYLVHTLDPHKEAGFIFGVSSEEVQAIFSPRFEITRTERDDSWRRGSTWIWMRRRE